MASNSIKIVVGDDTGLLSLVFPEIEVLRSSIVATVRPFPRRNGVTFVRWLNETDFVAGFRSGEILVVKTPIWSPQVSDVENLVRFRNLRGKKLRLDSEEQGDGLVQPDLSMEVLTEVFSVLPNELDLDGPPSNFFTDAVATISEPSEVEGGVQFAVVTRGGLVRVVRYVEGELSFVNDEPTLLSKNGAKDEDDEVTVDVSVTEEAGVPTYHVIYGLDGRPLSSVSLSADGKLTSDPEWRGKNLSADELGLVPRLHTAAVAMPDPSLALVCGDAGRLVLYERGSKPYGRKPKLIDQAREAITGGSFLEGKSVALTEDGRHAALGDVRGGVRLYWEASEADRVVSPAGLVERCRIKGLGAAASVLRLLPMYTDEDLENIASSRKTTGEAQPADHVRLIAACMDTTLACFIAGDGDSGGRTGRLVWKTNARGRLTAMDVTDFSTLVIPSLPSEAELAAELDLGGSDDEFEAGDARPPAEPVLGKRAARRRKARSGNEKARHRQRRRAGREH